MAEGREEERTSVKGDRGEQEQSARPPLFSPSGHRTSNLPRTRQSTRKPPAPPPRPDAEAPRPPRPRPPSRPRDAIRQTGSPAPRATRAPAARASRAPLAPPPPLFPRLEPCLPPPVAIDPKRSPRPDLYPICRPRRTSSSASAMVWVPCEAMAARGGPARRGASRRDDPRRATQRADVAAIARGRATERSMRGDANAGHTATPRPRDAAHGAALRAGARARARRRGCRGHAAPESRAGRGRGGAGEHRCGSSRPAAERRDGTKRLRDRR